MISLRACKADGIWDAIKASCCILCGARTLAGALVPLVGAAPTNNNFLPEDYNRETGLVGNGSTKYLDSNFVNDSSTATDLHMSAYTTSTDPTGYLLAARIEPYNSANTDLFTASGVLRARVNTNNQVLATLADGLQGATRSGTTVNVRSGENTGTGTVSGEITQGVSFDVFAREPTGDFSTNRIAFYSLGSVLDLALLNTRVTALVNAIGAAL